VFARFRYNDLKEAARDLRRTRALCKFNGGRPCRLVFEKGNHSIPVTGGFLRKECRKLFSYRKAS